MNRAPPPPQNYQGRPPTERSASGAQRWCGFSGSLLIGKVIRGQGNASHAGVKGWNCARALILAKIVPPWF